jgi:8-oxo-dGTP diphosphatase
LPAQEYVVRNGQPRPKVVHYWVARVVGDDDVSTYRPNAEIDDVAWVSLERAAEVLSYDRDRTLLEAAAGARKKTVPLVVLRHGKAVPRRDWDGKDPKRPLSAEGQEQAERLVPLLDAYGVRRAVSSTSRRCWTTLMPYADHAALSVEVTAHLSEEKAAPRKVERLVERLLDRTQASVLCTHRPVLPYVWEALGIRPTTVAAGALLVVHHRRGSVVAVEHHHA